MASRVDMEFVREMGRKTTESMVITGEISDLLLNLATSTFGRKKMVPSVFLGPMAFDAAKRLEMLTSSNSSGSDSVAKINPGPFGPRRVRKAAHLILEKCGVTEVGPELFNGFANAVAEEVTQLVQIKRHWVPAGQASKRLREALKRVTAS